MTWVADYVGIPFKTRGKDRTGCDCYGLITLVYKEQYNIQLPSFTDYKNALDKEEIQKTIRKYKPILEGTETDTPEEGDIVLLGSYDLADHVGVVITNKMILHITKELGAVVESLSSTRIKNKIKGYYSVNKSFYTK